MTRRALAFASSTTDQTIYAGETSEKCPWRSRTALAVLTALNKAEEITENERDNYIEMAGIASLWFKQPAASPQEQQLASLTQSPDSSTAHLWVQRLLEEAGPTRVLAALEGLAVSWGVDLQPRVRADDTKRIVWTMTTIAQGDDAQQYAVKQHIPIDTNIQPVQITKTTKARRSAG